MKRLFTLTLLALTVLPLARAAQPTYLVPPGTTISNTNNGVVTIPPVIDAINFINYGIFNIITVGPSTPAPFETFDTLNFTNYGIMQSINGWRFTFNSNVTGKRHMASSFVNANGGLVSAIDPPALAFYTFGDCSVSAVDPSYLIIHATNIVNGGGLQSAGTALNVGANGLLELKGHNVDLSYGGLEVKPLWVTPFGTIITEPRTNFTPDIAIYDLYWGQTNFGDDNPLFVQGLWDGTVANAPSEPAAPAPLYMNSPAFSIINPAADSLVLAEILEIGITNSAGEPATALLLSNVVKQAVFVGVPSGFGVQLGFGSFASFPAQNRYASVDVLLTTSISNAVTGGIEAAALGFSDELASDTRRRGLSLNALYCSSPQTFRPQNYLLARGALGLGFPGLGYPAADFFLTSGQTDPAILVDEVTNTVVTAGAHAVYGSFIDNFASRLPTLPGSAISNMPGRILIEAESLDLTAARIRGEGLVKISTPHLISSSNAVIDVENISYDLGSTNGFLKIQNLVPAGSVSRLRGTIQAWSGVWSNSADIIPDNYTTTNDPVDTNIVIVIPAPITNSVSILFHALILDASLVATVVPVNVHQFTTRSTETSIEDNMSVLESFLVEGRSLTVNGGVSFPGIFPIDPLTGVASVVEPLRSFTAGNAPNLWYFTNNGTFSVVSEAHFGDDRPPYATFVNRGTLSSVGIGVRSEVFENYGTLVAAGALLVRADEAKLEGGSTTANTFAEFRGENFRMNNHTIDSGVGPLNLYVTNLLADAGEGSGNLMRTGNGFHLRVKPQQGDLLGTTLQTHAGNVLSLQVFHTWAAEDRGRSPAGYVNNAAIGTLVISSQASIPRFVFSGTGAQNALYVDLLDLRQLPTDLLNRIQINPSLTIYYAAAQLPSGFTLPLNTLPEEFLDGKLNGRLRWVSSYAGPNSSQATLVNGQPHLVNRALLNSRLIDSDQDGVANFFDGTGPNGGVFLTAAINIDVSGNGTVLPMVDGQPLLVGQEYTLLAQPAPGSAFFGWSGSVESESPQLTFVMQSGFSVTASFAFAPEAASFNGLFHDTDDIAPESSGSFTLTTTTKGSYSGKVESIRGRQSFSGTLNETGFGEAFLSGFYVGFQVAADEVTGMVEGDGWTSELQADRAVFNKKNNPSPLAGSYTLVFPGSGDPTNTALPLGDGYGTVKIDAAGKLKLKGALADGTKISQTTVVSGSGNWPLYAPLYKGEGHLLGWLNVGDQGDRDIGGMFNWTKNPIPGARYYPDGFEHATNVLGSSFNFQRMPLIGFTNGVVRIIGGDFQATLEESFRTQGKKVVGLGTNKLSISISPSQGAFKGSVVTPDTGKKAGFNGVILQKQGMGAGYVLGSDQSGRVTVQSE